MNSPGGPENEAAFRQRQESLSRWGNEGGALPEHAQAEVPELTNAELVQLRIRVIALENLVMTMLAQGPDRQLASVRETASYILPRPESTQHPLTIRAAGQMTDMIDRAVRYRALQQP